MSDHRERCPTCGRVLPKKWKPKGVVEWTMSEFQECRNSIIRARVSGRAIEPCSPKNCSIFEKCQRLLP